jgi:hypothetical protein
MERVSDIHSASRVLRRTLLADHSRKPGIQITPDYEENAVVATAAGIATFWADGDIVDVQGMVAGYV